jgi:signal transduction histidine kinase
MQIKGTIDVSFLGSAERPPLEDRVVLVDSAGVALGVQRAFGVCTEIAPDLWAFNAHPDDLYFPLLHLCRNSADAMPDGGSIIVAARNVEPPADAAREFVEIVVRDDGEGMTEEVLSQAFIPYFTTKAAGSGTGARTHSSPALRREARRHGRA